MEDSRIDRITRFSKIWWQSRADAEKSQEFMALGLGVSKKTVQNWEKGISAPDLFQGSEWFRILGLNPLPYYLAFLFPELFGDIDQIRAARCMTSNPRALQAIDRLERVQELVDAYGLGDYVSYDLGMLSKYSYYTGIIFKAYTYGTGEYIVTGGRYDRLLEQFGKKAPAVGFAIVVDQLMLALSRQKIQVPVSSVCTALVYEPEMAMEAIPMACSLRSQGETLQMVCRKEGKPVEAYEEWAAAQGIGRLLFLSVEEKDVLEVNLETGQRKSLTRRELILAEKKEVAQP